MNITEKEEGNTASGGGAGGPEHHREGRVMIFFRPCLRCFHELITLQRRELAVVLAA